MTAIFSGSPRGASIGGGLGRRESMSSTTPDGTEGRPTNQNGYSERTSRPLDGVLGPHVESGAVPGLVALVSRGADVRVALLGAQGVGGKPMTRDTLFRISSMTKPVTAVAALILVEDGALALDEPVERLLPELARCRVLKRLDGPVDDTVPAKRAITVRDLLTFCMGTGMVMAPPGTYPIQNALRDAGFAAGPPRPSTLPDPDEWMRRLGTLPLLHQPGATWMYNTGSDVLGVLVARASRTSFPAFLEERIFAPLGMSDTAFSVPPDKVARLATSYATTEHGLSLFDPAEGGEWTRPPRFPAGGAGLVSTADDFHVFARLLLGGGTFRGVRVLSPESVRAMTRDQLTLAQKSGSANVTGFFDDHGWGYGVSVVTKPIAGGGSVGAYGWDGGMGTAWENDPARDLVAILMTQAMWRSPEPPPVCRDFKAAAYRMFP
jgi:CubicO group peptidase (beta-lactamase class C family)